MRHSLIAILSAAALIVTSGQSAGSPDPGVDRARIEALFESQVRPVLMDTCFKCHGGEKTKNNLRVDRLEHLLTGGDTGPAIKPGDAEGSLLIQAIRHHEEKDLQMPPKEKLPAETIAAFERWVAAGAPWPNALSIDPAKMKRHWAFEPIDRTIEPPTAGGATGEWSQHPIDLFIHTPLSAAGLKPNAPADRRTLIRRAYLDLVGLPPTPEEIHAFISDDSADAWPKLIEGLLASPLYGERWGRHWLDVARYADTSGDGADAPIPEAHLYRDYVIAAFNRDMPYDQFLVEQIAGDILAKHEPVSLERDRERMIATGYIALSRRFNNGEYADMHLVIDNTLDTIGRGVMGMTLSCARCHDHKFDPITQADYYGMYGYFSSTLYPHPSTEHGKERKNFVKLPAPPHEIAVWREQVAALQRQIKDAEDYTEKNQLREQLAKLEASEPHSGLAYAVLDYAGEIGNAPILKAGNPREKGEVIPRGFIAAISGGATPEIPADESGRLQFARWIASAENPLTARVMANRIWQYHFGTGIVPTSSLFGLQGEDPTHPELLDWLATQFVNNGWSIKQMHRLIMTSQTYQLAADMSVAEGRRIDPANKLYWRYPTRRLDAEVIRDSVLAVSGRLDLRNPGAPPFPLPIDGIRYDYSQHRPFNTDYDHLHRTVYLPTRRLGKHPYLEIFNGPDTNESAARREVSTVPLQALFWMNSAFVRESSRAFAQRVLTAAEQQTERVTSAYEYALGRAPSKQELADALSYLKQYEERASLAEGEAARTEQAWTSFCRILLASNEFLYVN